MLGKYCKIPCGKTVLHRDVAARTATPLKYNEYIVFDQDRIRIRFIVHCERGVLSSSSSSYVLPTTVMRTTTLRPISSGPTNNRSVAVPRPLTSTVTSSSSRMTSSQNYTLPSTRPSISATNSNLGSGSTGGFAVPSTANSNSSRMTSAQNYTLPSTRPVARPATTISSGVTSSNPSNKVPTPKPLASVTNSSNRGSWSTPSYSVPSSTSRLTSSQGYTVPISQVSTVRSSGSNRTNDYAENIPFSATIPLLNDSIIHTITANNPYYNRGRYESSLSDSLCSCCVIL